MPDEAVQRARVAIISDNPRLFIPQTTRIEARISRLAILPRPTHAERAELAALYRSQIDRGTIVAENVWTILCVFHDIGDNNVLAHPPEESGWLESIDRDMVTVWDILQQHATGKAVDPPSPISDDDTSAAAHEAALQQQANDREHTVQWYRETMRSIDACLGFDLLSEFDLSDDLPSLLRRVVEWEFHTLWFRSPYSLGAALESLPLHGGECFGFDTGLMLLDALARTTLRSMDTCNDMPPGDEQTAALLQLDLHWMILKGFTYSLVHANNGKSLATALVDQTDMVDTVIEALSDGLSTLRANTLPANRWGTQGGAMHTLVDNMPTHQLVTDLTDKIIEAQRRGRPPQ